MFNSIKERGAREGIRGTIADTQTVQLCTVPCSDDRMKYSEPRGRRNSACIYHDTKSTRYRFQNRTPPGSTFLSCTGPARAIRLGYSPCLKTIGWVLPSSDKPKSGRGERHEPGGLRLQRAFFQNAQRFGGRLQLRPCGRVACHRRCMNLLHRCFAFLHCATLRNSTKLE